MEMLAGLKKELADDKLSIWALADSAVGEALELAGGVEGALDCLSVVLEHIGPEYHTPVGTSGETPLMRP